MTGGADAGGQAGPLPGPGGRRHARGARGDRLHQQPRRGEAPGGRRLPGQGGGRDPEGALAVRRRRDDGAGQRRRDTRAARRREAACRRPGDRARPGRPARGCGPHGPPLVALLPPTAARHARGARGPGARACSCRRLPAPEAQRTINVKLFFDAPDARGLVLEERAVPFSSDIAAQIRTLVEELCEGIAASASWPRCRPRRRSWRCSSRRGEWRTSTCRRRPRDGLAGGSDAEMRTVYSVVDSHDRELPVDRARAAAHRRTRPWRPSRGTWTSRAPCRPT